MWIVRGGWDLDRKRTISSISDIWWREIIGSLLLTDIEVEPPTREHPLKQRS
jgi:hypothetical protein